MQVSTRRTSVTTGVTRVTKIDPSSPGFRYDATVPAWAKNVIHLLTEGESSRASQKEKAARVRDMDGLTAKQWEQVKWVFIHLLFEQLNRDFDRTLLTTEQWPLIVERVLAVVEDYGLSIGSGNPTAPAVRQYGVLYAELQTAQRVHAKGNKELVQVMHVAAACLDMIVPQGSMEAVVAAAIQVGGNVEEMRDELFDLLLSCCEDCE